MKEWTNWSGSAVARPAQQLTASTETELSSIVTGSTGTIRMIGAGHSFTPIAAINNGIQLSLSGFDHVAQAGPDQACIGAGGRLGDISSKLHAIGHAFSNMGDINNQTLAGALATATHGTGLGFGCYSSMLSALTLIDGQGQTRVLSRDADQELFKAMAVGLGTGGIVTEAVMHTTQPYRLDRKRYALGVQDLLDDMDARLTAQRNVEFFYITGSGQALVMESSDSTDALIARPKDRDQEGLAQLRLAARLLSKAPRLRRFLLGRTIKSHTREHFIEDWHRAYPSDRDGIRFNETEYHLPLEMGPKALREVINLIETTFPEVYFPMEIRTVGADDLYLSPFYKRNAMSIAVHHEAGQPFDALLTAVEQIFQKYEGRPHWGKLHSLTSPKLRALYPNWDIAIEARRELDPENRFVTPYVADLLGL